MGRASCPTGPSSCRRRSTSGSPSRSSRPCARHIGCAGVTGLVGEEAIAELGVIAVSVEEGVRPVGLDEFGVGHGGDEPAVIGLAGELQDPQRHRDGDPVGGELTHERVEPFPGRFAWER